MAKNILLIDDDKLILMTLKRLLTREGYKVSVALNGKTALRRIKEEDFDLIMSDIKMPEMDGIETVKRIREYLKENDKNSIPEIFITAYAKEEIYKEALVLNAAGYIEKPFDIKTLQETVKKLIENQLTITRRDSKMAKKILVIDDEELIIKSLSKLLEQNGYEVFIAKNGQDAIVMTEEEDFDLILADIRMPGMNGVETVEHIYRKIQGKRKIPTIFITGYADEMIEKKAKVLTPAGYIYKPFDMEDLLNRIKKALG